MFNPWIAVTIANAAPALMPRIPGPPNGLRVTPWVIEPAAAKQAPAAIASRVRGNRNSRTTICAVSSESKANRAAQAVPRSTATGPTKRLQIEAKPSRVTASKAQPIGRREPSSLSGFEAFR